MDNRLQEEMARLTPREQDIIKLLLLGCDIAEISKHLSIARRTVKAHLGRIYLRFGIIGGIKRVKLARLLLSEGCVPFERTPAPIDTKERDQKMIELVSQGLSNRQMAMMMGTSEYAIKSDLKSIYDRLGVWTRLELALWYEGHQQRELVN
jgi:DNA-binding CsgD family transcriptional regulator